MQLVITIFIFFAYKASRRNLFYLHVSGATGKCDGQATSGNIDGRQSCFIWPSGGELLFDWMLGKILLC